MDVKILDTFVYLAMGSVLVPLVLLLIHFKRQPLELKWLAYMLAFSFVADLSAITFYAVFNTPVNIFNNLYSTLNPILLSCFFYAVLRGQRLKVALIIFNAIFLIFCSINLLFIQKISINSYSSMVEKLLIMGLSIVYFYKLLEELPAERIYQIGMFWIVSAIFITNSAKLVLFSFVTYLITAFSDNLVLLWVIHNSMSVICNLLIAWGVWVASRPSGTVVSSHL